MAAAPGFNYEVSSVPLAAATRNRHFATVNKKMMVVGPVKITGGDGKSSVVLLKFHQHQPMRSIGLNNELMEMLNVGYDDNVTVQPVVIPTLASVTIMLLDNFEHNLSEAAAQQALRTYFHGEAETVLRKGERLIFGRKIFKIQTFDVAGECAVFNALNSVIDMKVDTPADGVLAVMAADVAAVPTIGAGSAAPPFIYAAAGKSKPMQTDVDDEIMTMQRNLLYRWLQVNLSPRSRMILHQCAAKIREML